MSPQKNEQIMIGRAKNALLSFFEQRLSVPKIYLDADWEGAKVDVLAIDRAGVGDVSVALIADLGEPSSLSSPLSNKVIQLLHSIPAHYKYLVVVSKDGSGVLDTELARGLAQLANVMVQLYAEDGVGRIGIISVNFQSKGSIISVPLSAERFRSNQRIFKLADAFSSQHAADFEVRP